jgi:hypothetical protein
MIPGDKRKPHDLWIAKNCVAFWGQFPFLLQQEVLTTQSLIFTPLNAV